MSEEKSKEELILCNLCKEFFDKKTRMMNAVILTDADESKAGRKYRERNLHFCSKCTDNILTFLGI